MLCMDDMTIFNTSSDVFGVWSTSGTLLIANGTNFSAGSSSSGSKGMSTIGQIAWTVMFSIMLLVAIGGNSIVMWIVVAHRRMRTVTNYFLVNLSIADLLMSTLNCLFNFIYMLRSDWLFGEQYCTINNFIANVTVAASVFTLTGISFDRYLAIVRPLQPRMSKKCAILTIASIWLAGMFLAAPCLMYSTTITYKYKGYRMTACILIWPDGPPNVSTMDCIYEVVIFVVTYLLPMVVMSRCYLAMGRELWGSRSIGEFTQRQADSIRSKRKVVRMFAVIVGIFAVCWLPYQLYFIYMHIDSSLLYWKYTQNMYLMFYWLAMANAMVNPIIYYWMNTRFRGYFKQAVCGWRVLLVPRRPGEPGSPPVQGHTHSYSHSRSVGICNDGSFRKPRQTLLLASTKEILVPRHSNRRSIKRESSDNLHMSVKQSHL